MVEGFGERGGGVEEGGESWEKGEGVIGVKSGDEGDTGGAEVVIGTDSTYLELNQREFTEGNGRDLHLYRIPTIPC